VAQRVRRDGAEAAWEQILASRMNLFPEVLLGGDGEVRAVLQGSLFGAMDAASAARTDLRLPGQLADRDIGLTYNQFRWYDAEAGVFLSPEPIGLEGGFLAYAYAGNRPLYEVDPDGLATAVVTSTVTGTAGSFAVPSGPGNLSRPLHPAVAASLPHPDQLARHAFDDGTLLPAERCGDPHAFSNYLRAWENSHTPPRRCDPATPAGRGNLAAALGSISGFQAHQTGGKSPGPRAPCPNCSQTISRLYGLAGMPPPGAEVIRPGRFVENQSGSYEDPHPLSKLTEDLKPGATPATDPRLSNAAAYKEAAAAAGWYTGEASAEAATGLPKPGTYRYTSGKWGPRE